MESQWKHKIFTVNEKDFEPLAMEIFRFQYRNNPVYREYVDALPVRVSAIESLAQIPFLPIGLFKSHPIQTTEFQPSLVFESSGTTGTINSRHFVKDASLYKESFTKTFESFYGPISDWCIIGLLPSYLERSNSSLVYMVDELVRMSKHSLSGFYLNEYEKLSATLSSLEAAAQKTLLIGVSFALLEFAEEYSLSLKHTIVMETGGMKGRRHEMVRAELHDLLKRSFGLNFIHSEYGMTELLSQAYSKGEGIFFCPPWMRVFVRDEDDPLSIVGSPAAAEGLPQALLESGVWSQKSGLSTIDYRLPTHTGAINIIDLANIYSCSFIATDDTGRLFPDGRFEVLGRMDNSDLRGCSLLTM